MVDFFLLLMLAGAGDELQGIKKGIMEMADVVVINKADNENVDPAEKARAAYQNALHLFPPAETGWSTKVVTSSAVTGNGLKEISECLGAYYQHMEQSGRLETLRNRQNVQWLHDLISSMQMRWFNDFEGMQAFIKDMESAVARGRESPYTAAVRLMRFRLGET